MTRLSASTENNSNNNLAVMSCGMKGGCHQVSMTNIELARAADASFALHQSGDSLSMDKPRKNPLGSSGVRFSLRKRSTPSDRPKGAMCSAYNSAFLSGLFADIASASNNDEQDPRLNEGTSIKKSRTSMTRSLSRCHQSYHNLAEVVSPPNSPGATPSAGLVRAREDTPDTAEHTISRENSLSYQLHCVSSSSSDEDSLHTSTTTDFCKLAFPNLPATVSDQDLTQMLQSRTSSDTPKETYGWFVEMDTDDVDTNTDAYKSSNEDDLAFSAPTAPKAAHNDDQVEWAKAADTVDDVLGDFF